MAIFAQKFFPIVTGYSFGFLIEIKNMAVQVMGDDADIEVVKNALQIFLISEYF